MEGHVNIYLLNLPVEPTLFTDSRVEVLDEQCNNVQ